MAGNCEELRELLEWMVMEVERITSVRRLTFEETEKISRYLEEIRLLLDELSFCCAQHGPVPETILATGLILRFLELEGRVKELRNDLARPPYREKP